MATKSIIKNVNIKGRKQVKAMVDALEHAQHHKGKTVIMTRTVNEVRQNKVTEFFSNYF